MNVLMPQLGETVAEGTVARWYKNVGDRVTADDVLFDVETDKASMEVPAQAAGVLTQILVPAGTTVDVGTVLAVIESGDAAVATPAEATPASTSATPAPAEPEAEAAPPPATEQAPPPSWYAAMPPAILGTEEPPPAATATPAATSEDAPRRLVEPGSSTFASNPLQRDGHPRLSPAVRRLAAEYRLDLTTIAGSGRNGRITRRNVVDFIAVRESQPPPAPAEEPAPEEAESAPTLAPVAELAPAVAATSPATAEAATSPAGGTIPFTRIRRLTAEHMVRSKATSPHVLQAVEVDFHRVDQLRKSVREAWKAKHGYSLTFLPFIAHAVCQALREFPNVNSSVQGDGIVLHEHVNLGIAIDLGAEGLVAPNIKSAETLSVAQLSTAIQALAQRSRSGSLKPDDFAGGTYTLTNNGTFGTLITAPIINQPQVAILSTDGVRKKPVVVEGPDGDSIAIRPVGILAQSFDHRAIDGAYSAAFLDRVRKILEAGRWTIEV